MDHNSLPDVVSTPLDARIVRTRGALRDALLTLLEEKPFDEITIRDISARAGTGYATFFRHYDTKIALLDDVAADQISALLNLAMPDVAATETRAAALALCRHVDTHRTLWSTLLTGGAAGRMREEFVRQAKQNTPGETKSDSWLPEDLKVIYGVGAAVEILAWWLQRRRDFTVEQVAEIVDRLVIAPVMNAP